MYCQAHRHFHRVGLNLDQGLTVRMMSVEGNRCDVVPGLKLVADGP